MTLDDVYTQIGIKIVGDAKSNLKKYDKLATSKLYNSLKYKIEGESLSFEMEDYGKWVDWGRRPGKFVPVDALNKWLKIKGIDLKYSFVINRAIKERGIKATYFFTDAYDASVDDIDKAIDKYMEGMVDDI